MHSDWSITQNVNKRSDWLTLFALVVITQLKIDKTVYTGKNEVKNMDMEVSKL